MKKAILTSLVVLGAVQARAGDVGESQTSLQSTHEQVSSFHLVPVLGANFVNLKDDSNDSHGLNADSGFSVGALTEFGEGTYTFQTGLLYNEYRQKVDSNGITLKARFDYLSVPLLAKVNFMGTPAKTVYLKGGVVPSGLLSRNLTASDSYGNSASGAPETSSFDLPAILAVGGAFPIGIDKAATIELAYQYGLTNMNPGSGGRVHNEGVALLVGLSLGR
jgi:hypothetical protein